jgi:hypothetical protein
MSPDASEFLGSGALRSLASQPATPVEYVMELGDRTIPLNALLGEPILITFEGKISCRHCGAGTRKSYGEGYCYPCFKALARCDLCIVSPARCHYAAGTCREPAWGEAFCMQSHVVYLANSAGAKVGITKAAHLPGRWLDQGATAALVIMQTATRHQAGCVEAALARHVRDRTDWRGLVGGDARPIDLLGLTAQLRRSAATELAELDREFPAALRWTDAQSPAHFVYPVARYGSPARRLMLAVGEPIGGELLGIKGQYLMFDTGVFNVRRHTSYHVTIARGAGYAPVSTTDQLELFQ